MTAPAEAPPGLRFDPATRRLRLDPHMPGFVQDPYGAYAALHAHAPVFFWEDYGLWCVADFATVNRLLRDRRLGRERPGGYTTIAAGGERAHLADFDAVEACSMLELEPPVHTRLRKLVNRAFVSRQVERLRPRVETLAHELLDRIEAEGRADLIATFATPIPITIIAGMLGVPAAMGETMLDWSHRMVAMYMHGGGREAEDAANAAARDFGAFIRDFAAEKRARPGDDLLSVLLAAHESGEALSQDELVSSTILLLNAGHEATVHQIGNAVRTVLGQGGDPRRFFATPDTTAATVEECLRIDPPLHMFTRYAYEPVDIAEGVTLAPGDEVGLLLGAANSDPAAFDAPRAFRPGRADQKTVAFGAGIHFCVGAPLARLELQAALTVLFERLPGLRLEEEPRYRDSYHFHGLERLDVAW